MGVSRSLLVGEGDVKKLHSKGVGREASVEMLVEVDQQLREGWGWVLKHIRVVDADRLVQSLRHALD